jgi:hypothetical protein
MLPYLKHSYTDLIGSRSPLLLELVGRFELVGSAPIVPTARCFKTNGFQGSSLTAQFELRITVLLVGAGRIGREGHSLHWPISTVLSKKWGGWECGSKPSPARPPTSSSGDSIWPDLLQEGVKLWKRIERLPTNSVSLRIIRDLPRRLYMTLFDLATPSPGRAFGRRDS